MLKAFNTLFLLIVTLFSFSQGTQLVRQPTLSDNSIVFVYANDLWKVPITGGDAIRLTTNEGYEFAPHFSNDEKWIAFSAQYGGNVDVYVIPAEGGEPRRLTWHPSNDIVQGWTPDGEVLFRSSRKSHPTQTNTFFTIGLSESFPKELGVPRAAYGEVSNNGKYVAYTPITGWDEEWRNYRGGQAMPIWIVDLKNYELITTPQDDQERHLDPVWFNGEVYYLSERDYASNIWKFSPKTGEEKQITFHKKFDVKSLDANNDGIVYEQGGYIHVLDPNSGQSQQVEIHVKGDMNFARPRWEDIYAGQLYNPSISPNGKRAIFEHRGEIFSFPKEEGGWRNLSNSPGSAERYPSWSPDGDKIAWFSDKSGEYELVIANQMGEIQQSISIPSGTFYFYPVWSPDGEKLAFTDTDYNILVTNINTGKTKTIESDLYAHPSREMFPNWSPDSQWVTYAKQLPSHFKAVFITNVETGEKIQVTDGMADAISPVFDQSGESLYFLASTNYGLSTGWLDMSSYEYQPERSLYMAILNDSTTSPNLSSSDEEEVKNLEEEEETTTEEEVETDDYMVIQRNNLQERIVALDLASDNHYGLLAAPEGEVFVFSQGTGNRITLQKYSVIDKEASEFVGNVQDLTTSTDGSQLLFLSNGSWQISTTNSPPGEDYKLKMDGKIKIDPQAEYGQIFKEGWRFMRDFLYVDNVHGAPWDDVYDWYSPWVKDVRHRRDLNYLVDILSGEVAVGHSYVYGGDSPDLDYVPVGLLGADVIVKKGLYQIEKIYTGESWNPNVKAPLSEPGLEVNEGDFILSVNGKELSSADNFYESFEQTANRVITIEVSDQPKGERRELIITPVASESGLRTWDWIEANRKKVDELSGGRLAYVYVPNTGGRGYEYFNRYYFAQQDKQGVIIDERNNGGGSAADYMIDILNRDLFGYFNSRSKGNKPWTTPMAGIWGPKVMIINERAGSGGDLLPYMFREAEIGPLVGTRTWGGLVGTWDTPAFIDGGRMVAPRGGFFDVDGNWAVEGEGVAPDIEVIQDPASVIQGKDPQLEKAVEEALRLIPSQTIEHQEEPDAPVRWKRPEGYEKE